MPRGMIDHQFSEVGSLNVESKMSTQKYYAKFGETITKLLCSVAFSRYSLSNFCIIN